MPGAWKAIWLSLFLLCIPACQLNGEFGGIVRISPSDPVWNTPTPFDASATIDLANGDPIPDSYTVTAALIWNAPDGQDRPRLELPVVRVDDTTFRVHATADSALPNQVIDLRWVVEGTMNNLLAEEVRTFQVDCAGGPATHLAQMQTAVISRFGGVTTAAQLIAQGYSITTHGWGNMNGLGMPFVHPNPNIDVNTPSLLFFTGVASPSLTDFVADEPYTLVGWAYGRIHVTPGTPRPTLFCIPYHEWFIHEAGWHTPLNGGMVLDVDNSGPLPMPQAAIDGGADPSDYHPRIWDVHFWASPTGLPRTGLLNTAANGTLIPSTATPPPNGIFFYPPMPSN